MLANINILESIQNEANASFAKNSKTSNTVAPCATEKYRGAVNQVKHQIHDLLPDEKEYADITAVAEEEIQ